PSAAPRRSACSPTPSTPVPPRDDFVIFDFLIFDPRSAIGYRLSGIRLPVNTEQCDGPLLGRRHRRRTSHIANQKSKITTIALRPMKTPFVPLSVATLLLTLAAAHADAPPEVTDAIKKLSAQANYSWLTTPKVEGSEAARRFGPVEGKAEKDGLSYFKGTLGDNSYELAMNGQKLVVNYTGEWLTPSELGA